ncbi:MAG: serine hydrolase domain-containing protein [Pseudomonadota bacterium]|uniref:serine hydrolase domain-containing protein n=1 Tax=Ralstonia pickettii TaxID=329 RepID=UPI002714B79D|nr:serine hydrolase domain-containing protein [Ralstonia pickettii]MEE2976107.1 serine hydrolase domain-containing protein [Pseudomonadota bacterium]WKZ85080.1 beta-lactamase family protein [Ralstonia pickettii]
MAAPYTSAEAGIMQGFPPPLEKQIPLGGGLRPPFMHWALSHARETAPTSGVRHSEQPMPLPSAGTMLPDNLEMQIDGKPLRLSEYLNATHTDAFAVVYRGKLVYEHYRGDMRRHQPHIWASMTKSITGLLAAMLIDDGRLDPAAPLSRYVPELAGNPFGDATVQQNLDMEVPVAYPVELPPDLGLFGAVGIVPRKGNAPDNIYDFLKVVHTNEPAARKTGADRIWYYQNGSAEAVAWALRRIAGQRWVQLVTDRLWSRVADDDAYVSVDRLGTEMASGGFNSTLRDAARFGEAVRRAMAADTSGPISPAVARIAFRPATNQASFARDRLAAGRKGYGYRDYWYQCNDGEGSVEASGRFGQRIYINPRREMTVVKFASSPDDAARPVSVSGTPSPPRPDQSLESSTVFGAVARALHEQLQATQAQSANK